jgi:hypothetical protein
MNEVYISRSADQCYGLKRKLKKKNMWTENEMARKRQREAVNFVSKH